MSKDLNPAYAELRSSLEEMGHINSALALLQWDQEVLMPEKGGEQRAKTIGYLSKLSHEALLGLNKKKALSQLARSLDGKSDAGQAAVVREALRAYTRENKLPTAFVQELSEFSSRSHTAWIKARQASDFAAFLPYLKKMVALKQQEAEYVGYTDSPYDALLDAYEPDLTSKYVSVVLGELRDFLTGFVKKLQAAKNQPPSSTTFKGQFHLAAQQEFNTKLAQDIGFDFGAGRIDVSTHPFTTNFHPQDVRITTRYDETDVFSSIGSTIHEVGHALYEQGIPTEHFGTPLGEAISLGIHESQSRIWENNIGKSLSFWKHVYPKLQKAFPRPFGRIPLETFYQTLNRVTPSYIRTESDEVTYNLHIILRFEIEKDLIEGRLKVKDLPEAWNAKMKEYLGVIVPNDRLGVLQDVHWAGGSIGYFPTYALGNVYAAQFYASARKHLPELERDLAKGNFTPLREWLRKEIHAHGKFYTAESLVRRVTGEPLQTKYFIEYLTQKYTEIYRLMS